MPIVLFHLRKPKEAYKDKSLVSAIVAEDISVLVTFIVIEVAIVPHEETVLLIPE